MVVEMKKNPTDVKVFVAAVEDYSDWDVLPSFAAEELNTIKNPRVAAEKRAGYGLLNYAAKGLLDDFDVTKCYPGETGKPLHQELWFSVSHSGGAVAVAAAKVPVGLDIETVDSLERVKRLEKRILCPDEHYDNPLVLWTMKEAVFKLEGKDRIFRPADIDTNGYGGICLDFEYIGKKFVLSVVTKERSDTEACCISKGKEICIKKLDI